MSDNRWTPLPADVSVLFEPLHREILQAHARWKVFRQLFTTSDARMRLLNETAPGFFAIVKDVIRDDAFVALSRLTDKSQTAGKKTLSLYRLVDSLESHCDAGFVSDAQNRLAELATLVKEIRNWRHRKLAHIDLATALEYRPQPLGPVTRGTIDDALAKAAELMNSILGYYKIAPILYDAVYFAGDADVLLSRLEAAKSLYDHRAG